MKLIKTGILAVCLWLAAAPAFAVTWYVQKSGSGINCTQYQSTSTPAPTIALALACVGFGDGAGAGDIVEIRDATPQVYNESFAALPTGTAGNPFQLKATNAGMVRIRPSGHAVVISLQGSEFHDITIGSDNFSPTNPGLIIDGINQTTSADGTLGCIVLSNSGRADTNITIVGNEITNCWANIIYAGVSRGTRITQNKMHGNRSISGFDHGIYVDSAEMEVDHNDIFNVSGWGIHGYSTVEPLGPFNSRFHANRIWNFGTDPTRAAAGILLMGNDSRAWNNIVRAGDGDGINCYGGATGCKVYNNTIYGVTGYALSTEKGTSGAILRNNTVVGNSGTLRDEGASTTSSNNFTAGDPRYADAANLDFRPCTAAGVPHASCAGVSALIAAGFNLTATFTTDFAGTTRPPVAAWTIGAYEASAGTCPSTPALVAQYGFDGSAVDNSGNSNNGSEGAGVTYAAGKYGQAANFTGVGPITVADSTSLWLCTGFTISAWIKPTTTPTTFVAIAGKADRYWLYSSSSGYCAVGAPIAGFYQSGQSEVCYGTGFTANVWSYVTVTYDKTFLRFWVNGVNVSSAAATATLDRLLESFLIGGSKYGEYFTGLIDEVRVYNYARSGAQIATDMNTPINTLTVSVTLKFGAVTQKFGAVTQKIGLAQ